MMEYRVVFLIGDIWYSHTGATSTTKLDIAEAWLEQAKYRLGGSLAKIQSRPVTDWNDVE